MIKTRRVDIFEQPWHSSSQNPGATRTCTTVIKKNVQVILLCCFLLRVMFFNIGHTCKENLDRLIGGWRQPWQYFSYIVCVCGKGAGVDADERHCQILSTEFNLQELKTIYSGMINLLNVFRCWYLNYNTFLIAPFLSCN